MRAMETTEARLAVPFLDLSSVHRPIAADVLGDVADLLESGAFTNGPHVARFEAAFASYCGVAECVGLASGLDALRLAITALGLQPGDEVLVPALTFIATFEAVSQAGCVPVPVEISEADYCLDADAAAAAVGPCTKLILPVHLYGRMADMAALGALASSHGLAVLEDACQAHGAERDGIRSGATGEAAAFSFYPGKNLGALGDAGALVTNRADVAAAVRGLREHGQRSKYEHEAIGWTARLDTIQAAALLRKLPLLDEWNAERRAAADHYADALGGIGDLVLPDTSDRGQVWHLFVVRTADPTGLARHLSERGIGSGRHYPEPPHLSQAYRSLGRPAGSFPVAERASREVLSLPIFPGITEPQLDSVVAGVRSWFERG
jgi:dTDP-3-amino-3,4,6-trideoxy-alpha-D-glucose transaminase